MRRGQGKKWRGKSRPAVAWADDVPPMPEKPDQAVKRHGSGEGNFRGFILVLLPVLFLAVAGTVLGVRLLTGGEDRDDEPPRVPDPLFFLSEAEKRALTRPNAAGPGRLTLTFSGEPDALCKELAALGLDNTGWQRAPFLSGRWQCASGAVPLSTPSVDYGAATLFFLLRGPSRTKVDYLRLKLNVEDPRQMDHGQAMARRVIDALSGRYGWAVPEAFMQAVAGFHQLEMEDRGLRLSVVPEDPNLTGDASASRRLNIVIDFGEPEWLRPAGTFVRDP